MSDFGGSYSNSPGQWVFAADGTASFIIVGSASAGSTVGAGYDSWMRRFAAQLFGTEGDDTRMAGDGATVIYGMGGIIVPFIGIKLIDVLITPFF